MKPVGTSPPRDFPDGALVAPLEKPLRRLRVLVVDDDNNARTAIAAGLRGDGHDVHTFSGGVRALKLHSKQPFDAVVADLVMPGMSGGELAAAVKQLNPGTRLYSSPATQRSWRASRLI
jgi:CheY-like chemotaxis protein